MELDEEMMYKVVVEGDEAMTLCGRHAEGVRANCEAAYLSCEITEAENPLDDCAECIWYLEQALVSTGLLVDMKEIADEDLRVTVGRFKAAIASQFGFEVEDYASWCKIEAALRELPPPWQPLATAPTDITLSESWSGYEDMEMVFRITRPETDSEHEIRLAHERRFLREADKLKHELKHNESIQAQIEALKKQLL